MNRNALLAGAGLGALLMFLTDPARGPRRRALIRDKAVRGANVGGRALRGTAKDLRNRAYGAFAVTRRWMSGREIDETGRHRASATA